MKSIVKPSYSLSTKLGNLSKCFRNSSFEGDEWQMKITGGKEIDIILTRHRTKRLRSAFAPVTLQLTKI